MGEVSWLRELDDESYYFRGKEIVIERPAFESINDYTGSLPTAPSAGRVYRKKTNWREPDLWFVFVVDNDPTDPKFQLHRPYRVELVESS